MAVYKDKNGTWYVSARYDNWQGEHARKVKRGFKTKKDAMEWERDFLLEKAGSLDMTFEAFVELYKTNLKERLKQSTWQTKISIIDNKILPYFRKKRMTDIKVSDVVAWQNKLLNMADENGTRYSLVYLKTVHNQLSASLIMRCAFMICLPTQRQKLVIWEKRKREKCFIGPKTSISNSQKRLWISQNPSMHLKCCIGVAYALAKCLH